MPSVDRRLATLKRFLFIFGVVVVGVEAIVTAYYWSFGWERLKFELLMSLVISTAVGVPVIAYVVIQHHRLQALTEKLAVLSATDQMTGLLNRHTFLERLDLLLFSLPRDMRAGVFAYIDADHFKSINDCFGHALGDKVIQLLARHIRSAVRDGDFCARLGGEEFGVFLRNTDLAEAGLIADRLRRKIELSGLELGMRGLSLSVSIGLAAHKPGTGAQATMQEADRSLYAAKHGGRNAVVVELQRYRAA